MALKRISKQRQADLWYEENRGRIVWDKTSRDMFRETSHWKRFINGLKEKNRRCEFCSCNSSKINIHHLYPDSYDDLRKELFVKLDYRCHTMIHALSRRKDRSSVPEYFLRFLERR